MALWSARSAVVNQLFKNIFCLIRRVIGSEFHRCVVVAEERGVDTAQFSSSMWEHLQRSWVSCASFRVLAPCNP